MSAAQNSTMSVTAMIRPTGDGGVSTISSAAGGNARSSPRLVVSPRVETARPADLTGGKNSTDFMESCLEPMQRCIAAACPDECFMAAIFDESAALERDDAVGRSYSREPVGDDEDR